MPGTKQNKNQARHKTEGGKKRPGTITKRARDNQKTNRPWTKNKTKTKTDQGKNETKKKESQRQQQKLARDKTKLSGTAEMTDG